MLAEILFVLTANESVENVYPSPGIYDTITKCDVRVVESIVD